MQKMADVETEGTVAPSTNPVPAKRPTIIRAAPRSGPTNNDEDNSNQSSNTSPVDSDPQPADNSDVVIRKRPPARPATGPSRQPSVKPLARPASVHLRLEPKSTPRPASVHLPLSEASSTRDRPSTAAKPQRKRPEITIVSARPLSEVSGFSKGTCSLPGPSAVAKPAPSPTPKPAAGAVETPTPALTTPAAENTSATPGTAAQGVEHHPVAAPRRGVDSTKELTKSAPFTVENKSEPPGVAGTTAMSDAPPPLPTNRPKGRYVPPPLPSTRPKGPYVHAGSVSSSSVTEGKAGTTDQGQPSSELAPVPKPRPRSVASDSEETVQRTTQVAPSRPPQPATLNHVSDDSSKIPTPKDRVVGDSNKPILVLPPASVSKPESAGKPQVISKPPTPVERTSQAPVIQSKQQVSQPHVPPKPTEKPALPHPVPPSKPAENPSLPHPVAPLKPAQRTGNTSETSAKGQPPTNSHKHSEGPSPPQPAMPLLPPAAGPKYSRADILSLFDSTYQKNSKPESASTEDKTGSKNKVEASHLASAVAQNTTTQDVRNISRGAEMMRKSEDGQKAASSFTRIAKSTASDIRSSDASSGNFKQQVASSAVKNVSADDAKNIGKAGVAVARSEEGRKAASSIFNIAKLSMNQVNAAQTQNAPSPSPTARARPKHAGQQGGSSLGSLMGLMPPPKTPAQPAPKPSATGGSKPAPAPVPKFKISADPVAPGAPRSKPTIIRPGAEKQGGSKPNSRSNSPEPKRKVPPPRPSSGPQIKSRGSAPPRPSAPSSQPNSAPSANLKPKRRAPMKPGGPPAGKSSQSESLPPRPGPGHPLYDKYMVSEPHGIALYDYKPIQPDELAFKANDVIVLLKRIDADWLRGRCGNAEGLLPAAFLKIVKDIPQTDSKPSTSDPHAVAVYSFAGSAADELSFKEGDSIVLLDRAGDQWYRGQCKGRTGIFPANHVKVIEDLPVKSAASSDTGVSSGPRCKAKFDYDSANPEDLTFKQGDVIKLIDHMGPQWLKGQLAGKTGIFPESFVDVIEALPAAADKKPSAVVNGNSGNVVRALFDFDGVESNEISFKQGDKITILSQVNSEWLHGELRSGLQGNLPAAFVDHIPANLPYFSGSDSPSEIGEGIAKFDFKPAGDGELALKVGDHVTLLEYVGDDWLRGRVGSKEGIFPKTFVDIREKSKGGASSGGSSHGTCQAMYDFYAEEPDELTIVNGDVIEILEHISGDWLIGRLNGKTGKFPKAFVNIR